MLLAIAAVNLHRSNAPDTPADADDEFTPMRRKLLSEGASCIPREIGTNDISVYDTPTGLSRSVVPPVLSRLGNPTGNGRPPCSLRVSPPRATALTLALRCHQYWGCVRSPDRVQISARTWRAGGQRATALPDTAQRCRAHGRPGRAGYWHASVGGERG